MANTRRAGSKTALWNAAVTGVNGKSNGVEVTRWGSTLAIYVTVSAATTITVEAGQSADVNADGTLSDTAPVTWFPLFWNQTQVLNVFAAAGSACILVPNFAPAFVRLSSSATVTATAGWEMT